MKSPVLEFDEEPTGSRKKKKQRLSISIDAQRLNLSQLDSKQLRKTLLRSSI